MRPLALPFARLTLPALVVLGLVGCDEGDVDAGGFELQPIDATYTFEVRGSELGSNEVGLNAEDPFDIAAEIEAQPGDFGLSDVVAARVLDNETARLRALTGDLGDLETATLELGGGGEEPVDVASATDFSGGNSVDLDVESGADLTDVVQSGLIPAALRVEAPNADPGVTYQFEVRLRLLVEVEGL